MDISYYPAPMGCFFEIGCEDGALCRLKRVDTPGADSHFSPLSDSVYAWLRRYFAGEPAAPDFPMRPKGTPFQQAVWQALQTIPYGEMRTYGDIARQIGRPNACRAVGSANRVNPIWLAIPCHRCVGANGSLTGYAGGMEMKRTLLALERGEISFFHF